MEPLGTKLFDRLAACLDAYIAAWEREGDPPEIAAYLPKTEPKLIPVALLELVKVDIEYRFTRGLGRELDDYLEDYPMLAEPEGPPADLIFEDYTHRERAGLAPDPEAYVARYPGREAEIRRLLEFRTEGSSTSLAGQMPRNVPDPGGVIDDFLLIDQLGRGAFATVFLARQVSMQRTVALKVSANRGEEAETLAQLDHPNIVRVFDQRVLEEQDLRLLYMEYLPAGDLEQVVDIIEGMPADERRGQVVLDAVDRSLRARGETPPGDSMLRTRLAQDTWPEAVCRIGAQLARALSYAHARGVLHRDVKPANVLLARTGAAKLVDFNISYSTELEGSSAAAYLGGSMAYMPAEQLEACSPLHDKRPDDLDGRADIYALGVVLFELLTGARPFDEEDQLRGGWTQAMQEMIDARRAGIHPTRRALVPKDAPPLLLPTIERCLGAAPEDRFPDAGALARQLDLALMPRAAALIEPPADSAARWARRHGLLALLLGALIPNVVLTVLNVLYNLGAVFGDEAHEGFMQMVTGVNAVAYTIGLGITVAWMRRVGRAVGAVEAGAQPDGPARAEARRQMLALPQHIAYVIFPLWVLGGIAFPIWLQLEGGSDFLVWFDFTASNVLFGVLAATGVYFILMRIVLSSLLPPFLDVGAGTPEDRARLAGVGPWAAIWFGVLTAVPFVSIILLAVVDPGTRERTSPFLALGLIGTVCFALAYLAMLRIRRDLAALGEAITPRE